MDFLKFVKSLKTEENSNLLENVVIPAFKNLFEDETAPVVAPKSPEDTEALIEKSQKDIDTLNQLKQSQEALEQNQSDLVSKAPDLVIDDNNSVNM